MTLRSGRGGCHEGSDRCPFCGCVPTVFPSDSVPRMDPIKDLDEFVRIKGRFTKGPMSKAEAISIDRAMREFLRLHGKEMQDVRTVSDTLNKCIWMLEDGIRSNITGTLTRSSCGFESFCCRELAEGMECCYFDPSRSEDRYPIGVRLKDGRKIADFKVCPFCGKRMKRVPRHY